MEVRIFGFMPLRKGSKGIPGKNMAPVARSHLFQWALRSILGAAESVSIWDDYGPDVISESVSGRVFSFRRSPESATDDASPELAIREWLDTGLPWLDEYDDNVRIASNDSDIFLYTQATNPWTIASDFQQAVELLSASTDPDAYVIGAAKISPYQYSRKTIKGPYLTSQEYTSIAPLFDRATRGNRQTSDTMLKENGSIYCTTIGALKRNGTHKGTLAGIVEMPEYTALEIDSPHHLVMARALCEHYQCTPPELRHFIQ